jgi:hypothetical protein
MLPQMTTTNIFDSESDNKLLILAEGFEKRSLSWINSKENKLVFNRVLLCKYRFHERTNFTEILKVTKQHCSSEPDVIDYNRFEPSVFEMQFLEIINTCNDYDEIFIDISVMSKMLILIILYSLKNYNGKIKIIYSEPETWGPTEENYNKALIKKENNYSWISLSSVGISNVTRTPNLSSIIMQNCPTLLISNYSFNEQLLGALLNEISPSKLQMIGHSCKRQEWRKKAMIKIHDDVIYEFFHDSIEEIISADVLDYVSVFEKLTDVYKEHCYDYRIVISPTGGKLHAVSAALLKLCCPDVHVEYPTPNSYFFEDYSSDKTHAIHRIDFNNFKEFIIRLSNEYKLNG